MARRVEVALIATGDASGAVAAAKAVRGEVKATADAAVRASDGVVRAGEANINRLRTQAATLRREIGSVKAFQASNPQARIAAGDREILRLREEQMWKSRQLIEAEEKLGVAQRRQAQLKGQLGRLAKEAAGHERAYAEALKRGAAGAEEATRALKAKNDVLDTAKFVNQELMRSQDQVTSHGKEVARMMQDQQHRTTRAVAAMREYTAAQKAAALASQRVADARDSVLQRQQALADPSSLTPRQLSERQRSLRDSVGNLDTALLNEKKAVDGLLQAHTRLREERRRGQQVESQLQRVEVKNTDIKRRAAGAVEALAKKNRELERTETQLAKATDKAANATVKSTSAKKAAASGLSNLTKQAKAAGLAYSTLGTHIGGVAIRLQGSSIALAGMGMGVTMAASRGRQALLEQTMKTADFERDLMTAVAIMGDEAGVTIDTVRQKVLDLARDTVYTSDEVMGATMTLIKAGQDWQEIDTGQGLDGVLQFAQATGAELAPSVELITTLMNVFQDEAGDLPKMLDTVTRAINGSKIEANDFIESLKNMGPIASQLGISIEDVAKSIGVMGNMGIKGGPAGTALRYMWLNFIPRTPVALSRMEDFGLIQIRNAEAVEAMNSAGVKGEATLENLFTAYAKLNGVTETYADASEQTLSFFNRWVIQQRAASSVFFDQEGHFLGMGQAIKLLWDQLKDMPKDDQMRVLSGLFGERGGSKGAAVFTDVMDNMLDNLNEMEEQGLDVNNVFSAMDAEFAQSASMNELAATRMSGLAGSVERVRGSYDSLIKSVSSTQQGPLTNLVMWVDRMVDSLYNLTRNNPQLAQFVGALLNYGVAALTVLGPTLMLAAAWPYLKVGLLSLVTAIGPLALALGALGIVAAGVWQAFSDEDGGLRGALPEVGAALKGLADTAKSAWATLDRSLFKPLSAGVAAFVNNDFAPAMQRFIGWLGDQLPRVSRGIVQFARSFLGPVFRGAGDFIKNQLLPAFRGLWDWLMNMLPRAAEGFGEALEGVVTVGRTLWDAMTLLVQVFGPVIGFLTTSTPLVKTFVMALVAYKVAVAGITMAQKLWAGTQAAFMGPITRVRGALTALKTTIDRLTGSQRANAVASRAQASALTATGTAAAGAATKQKGGLLGGKGKVIAGGLAGTAAMLAIGANADGIQQWYDDTLARGQYAARKLAEETGDWRSLIALSLQDAFASPMKVLFDIDFSSSRSKELDEAIAEYVKMVEEELGGTFIRYEPKIEPILDYINTDAQREKWAKVLGITPEELGKLVGNASEASDQIKAAWAGAADGIIAKWREAHRVISGKVEGGDLQPLTKGREANIKSKLSGAFGAIQAGEGFIDWKKLGISETAVDQAMAPVINSVIDARDKIVENLGKGQAERISLKAIPAMQEAYKLLGPTAWDAITGGFDDFSGEQAKPILDRILAQLDVVAHSPRINDAMLALGTALGSAQLPADMQPTAQGTKDGLDRLNGVIAGLEQAKPRLKDATYDSLTSVQPEVARALELFNISPELFRAGDLNSIAFVDGMLAALQTKKTELETQIGTTVVAPVEDAAPKVETAGKGLTDAHERVMGELGSGYSKAWETTKDEVGKAVPQIGPVVATATATVIPGVTKSGEAPSKAFGLGLISTLLGLIPIITSTVNSSIAPFTAARPLPYANAYAFSAAYGKGLYDGVNTYVTAIAGAAQRARAAVASIGASGGAVARTGTRAPGDNGKASGWQSTRAGGASSSQARSSATSATMERYVPGKARKGFDGLPIAAGVPGRAPGNGMSAHHSTTGGDAFPEEHSPTGTQKKGGGATPQTKSVTPKKGAGAGLLEKGAKEVAKEAKKETEKGKSEAEERVDLLKKWADAITSGIEALQKLARLKVPTNAVKNAALFAAVMAQIVGTIEAHAKAYNGEKGNALLETTGKYADVAEKSTGLISGGIDAFLKLEEYQAPSREVLKKLLATLAAVVGEIIAMAAQWDDETVVHAGLFADSALKGVELISSGVDAFVKLDDFVSPAPAAVQNFVTTLRSVMTLIAGAARDLDEEAVDAGALYAEGAGKVASGLQSVVELLNTLAGPKMNISPSVDRIKELVRQSMLVMNFLGNELTANWAWFDVDGRNVERVSMFAEGVGKVAEGFGKAIELFNTLRDPKYSMGPILAKAKQLALQVVSVMNELGSLISHREDAPGWRDQDAQKVGNFAEAGGKVSEALSSFIGTLRALAEENLDTASLETRIKALVRSLHMTVEEVKSLLSDTWDAGEAEAWAGAGESITGALSSTLSFLGELTESEVKPDELRDRVSEVIRALIDTVENVKNLLVDSWDAEQLEAWSSAGGGVADALGSTIGFFEVLKGTKVKPDEMRDRVSEVVRALIDTVENVKTLLADDWDEEKLGAFADAGGAVIETLASTLELLASLASTKKLGTADGAGAIATSLVSIVKGYREALRLAGVELNTAELESQTFSGSIAEQMGRVIESVSSAFSLLESLSSADRLFRRNPARFAGALVAATLEVVRAYATAKEELSKLVDADAADTADLVGRLVSGLEGPLSLLDGLADFRPVSSGKIGIFMRSVLDVVRELKAIPGAIAPELEALGEDSLEKLLPAFEILQSALDLFKGITGEEDDDGKLKGGLKTVDPAAVRELIGKLWMVLDIMRTDLVGSFGDEFLEVAEAFGEKLGPAFDTLHSALDLLIKLVPDEDGKGGLKTIDPNAIGALVGNLYLMLMHWKNVVIGGEFQGDFATRSQDFAGVVALVLESLSSVLSLAESVAKANEGGAIDKLPESIGKIAEAMRKASELTAPQIGEGFTGMFDDVSGELQRHHAGVEENTIGYLWWSRGFGILFKMWNAMQGKNGLRHEMRLAFQGMFTEITGKFTSWRDEIVPYWSSVMEEILNITRVKVAEIVALLTPLTSQGFTVQMLITGGPPISSAGLPPSGGGGGGGWIGGGGSSGGGMQTNSQETNNYNIRQLNVNKTNDISKDNQRSRRLVRDKS